MTTHPVDMTSESVIPKNEERMAMSYEDFLAWSDETKHTEWVKGEVIIFMPPKKIHQDIVGFIHNLLSLYTQSFGLGVTKLAPFEMKLEHSSREPDILFVSTENQDRLTNERLNGPADLVIEIISDSSVGRDRGEKFYEYQEAGIREYWIVDPRPNVARSDFFHLTERGQYQAVLPNDNDQYYSGVLPDFWLRPSWFEVDPLPNPLACLAEIAPQILRDALNQQS